MRGFADQQPRNKKDPADPSNRRISLIVQYLEKKQAIGIESDKVSKEAEVPAGERE